MTPIKTGDNYEYELSESTYPNNILNNFKFYNWHTSATLF